MAKKKKHSKKNKSKQAKEIKKNNGFYLYASATILILISIILLIGGFNTGGSLPVSFFHGIYWLFGVGAYFTILGLLIIGYILFKLDEDYSIPVSKLINLIIAQISFSSIFYVLFANKSVLGTWTGGYGGRLGKAVGLVLLSSFDKIPALSCF